jgi:hypothetical protein
VLLILVACSGGTQSTTPSKPPAPAAAGKLLAPEAFAGISDRDTRSRAMFVEVSRVLLHARCVNCHPADDSPRQGDRGELHDPPVVRGPADRGVVGMQCQTCHQDRNLELARVPGAKDWHLAPLDMAWQGKTPGELCVQLSDPMRNGGRTLAQIEEHLGHDALVAWGWAPGSGRASAPGTQQELATLFHAWIESGAVCPSN